MYEIEKAPDDLAAGRTPAIAQFPFEALEVGHMFRVPDPALFDRARVYAGRAGRQT